MSRAAALPYRFPRSVTVRLADEPPYLDQAAFDAGHEALLARLRAVLADAGITDFDTDADVFRTGGHADITYRAVRWGDDMGGAEVVLHEVSWGGDYVPLAPWIVLFGGWRAHADALAALRGEPTASET